MKPVEFKVSFWSSKFVLLEQELESANNGYWSQDIWNPEDSPLRQDYKSGLDLRKINFTKIKSRFLRTEIKFAYYRKVKKGDWSLQTLHKKPYVAQNWLSVLLNNYPDINCFLDKNLDEWTILFRTLLIENDAWSPRKRKLYLKSGEIKDHIGEDSKVSILANIYKTLEEFYDDREEWKKDIWLFKNIGVKPHRRGLRRLNFTSITQPWLKDAVKKFCKHQLVTGSYKASTCSGVLTGLKYFSFYLNEDCHNISPNLLNRSVAEGYLAYLLKEYSKPETRVSAISSLNSFLTQNDIHHWLPIQTRLIYPGDYPKVNKNSFGKKVISDEVIKQLLENILDFPIYQQRMLIILANVGMRITELMNISLNCISSDKQGKYLITYYQSKVNSTITKPIASIFHDSTEVINAIKEQQKEVIEKLGVECPYLFPSVYSRPGHIKTIGYSTIAKRLKQVACTRNIRDENGKFWNFHPHQFRHTVGTELANDDSIGLFGTQAYLGHQSIDMTLRYAKLDEKKLQKKIEKFNDNNQVIDYTGKSIKLDQDERFKENWNYIKEGNLTKAQTVEGGICTLPAMLSPCPHKHKCLSCTHLVTTPEHLPFHVNEYKIQLARKTVAEARGQKRVIEDYDNTLEQLEKIIAKCGGDLETIKASVNNQESTAELNMAQIQQLMSKMGLSSIEELKQVIESIEESQNG